MNIEAMFPTGREVGDKFLVRRGRYDWPAAIKNDEGEWVVTDFGRRFALPEPKREVLHLAKRGKK
jgi:hypothetical protein